MADRGRHGEVSGGRGKRLEALADHFLGFRTTADPERLQFGPQPPEGVLSVVCEAFGCPPDVAARQDMATVADILDYRNAHAAIELFNQGRTGMDQLLKQPHLQEILLRLTRAQNGAAVQMDDVLAEMRTREPGDGED